MDPYLAILRRRNSATAPRASREADAGSGTAENCASNPSTFSVEAPVAASVKKFPVMLEIVSPKATVSVPPPCQVNVPDSPLVKPPARAFVKPVSVSPAKLDDVKEIVAVSVSVPLTMPPVPTPTFPNVLNTGVPGVTPLVVPV